MQFSSQIFIDGGDPAETRAADQILKKVGHVGVQGQTTNPSLIAKRFLASRKGAAPPESELLSFWRQTVREMAEVTKGPISIQVVGDQTLTTEQMLSQARDRATWIPNAVVKFPATTAGLSAAEIFCQEGPVNITLAFSQDQAAAVYAATLRRGTSPQGKLYDIFVSPFVGRLDDRGEKGMDVAANISEMYKKFGDGHVKVLTASVRNVKHILYALWLKSDAVTIPFKIFKEWADLGFPQPPADFIYDAPGLTEIPYKELSLDLDWKEFNLNHDLTAAGIVKFWDDWKAGFT